MADQSLKHINEFYNKLEFRFDLFNTIEKGTFVTGSIKHIFKVLQALITEFKLINEKDLVLDAGSGDGRICAIFSILKIQSFGIEFNEHVYQSSIENINELLKNEYIPLQYKPKIIQGDFLDNESYSKLEISFSDITVFYNYVTYQDLITEKIVKESKVGTLFILHSPCPTDFSCSGLEKILDIPIKEIYHVIYVFRKI